MSNATALVVVHGGSEATATDLVLPPMTSTEWLDTWDRVMALTEASSWWLGALLANQPSESCSQAFDESLSTRARQCLWVYQSVPPENRRCDLSWSHHRLVAPFSHSEQVDLLEAAVENGLTFSKFEVMVKAYKDPNIEPKPPKSIIDKGAVQSICQSKEGRTWTVEDTRSVEFYLCL